MRKITEQERDSEGLRHSVRMTQFCGILIFSEGNPTTTSGLAFPPLEPTVQFSPPKGINTEWQAFDSRTRAEKLHPKPRRVPTEKRDFTGQNPRPNSTLSWSQLEFFITSFRNSGLIIVVTGLNKSK